MALPVYQCPPDISSNLKPLFEYLPLSNCETELKRRIKAKNETLVQFIKEIVYKQEWCMSHPSLIGRLFKCLHKRALNDEIPWETINHLCGLFHTTIPKLVHLVPNDLTIRHESKGDVQEQRVSRLVLAGNTPFFRSLLSLCYLEGKQNTFSLQKFASNLNFVEFQACWSFIQNGNCEKLVALDLSSLWNVIKQANFWSITSLQEKAESLLIPKITTASDALESLEGCDKFQLEQLSLHCVKIISANPHGLRFRRDGLGATITIPENLEHLEEYPITHLKVPENKLKVIPIDVLHQKLPELVSVQLLVTSNGISPGALQLFSRDGKFQSLQLRANKEVDDVESKDHPKLPKVYDQSPYRVDQLEVNRLPIRFRRLVLGLLRIIPIIDLRASSCPFMTDKFIESIARIRRPNGPPPLKGLDVGSCSITDVGMQWIIQFSDLRVLNLARTCVTNVGVEQALKNLERLEDLNIAHCHALSIDFHGVNAELFSKIKILKMGPRREYDDDNMRRLLTCASLLEKLTIYGSKGFDVSVMRSVSMPNLQVLNVDANSFKESDPKEIFTANKYPKLTVINVYGASSPEQQGLILRAIGNNSNIKKNFFPITKSA